MSLKDEVSCLIGPRRKFLLLRIAGVSTSLARNLVGAKEGTYNKWLRSENFLALYHRKGELQQEYYLEAIQLLRRDNQLEAVLLEEKILARIKEELETGEYNLIKSSIAKQIYDKLISDLDSPPPVKLFSWEERVQTLILGGQQDIPQIIDGEVVDRVAATDTNVNTLSKEVIELANSSTTIQQEYQLTEGTVIQESEQTSPEVKEASQAEVG